MRTCCLLLLRLDRLRKPVRGCLCCCLIRRSFRSLNRLRLWKCSFRGFACCGPHLQYSARARWLMAERSQSQRQACNITQVKAILFLDCKESFHNQPAIQELSATLMATSGLGSQASCKARHFDATGKGRKTSH